MSDNGGIFPDQSHIDRVRDALWSRNGSGASVMVGSGFSKCALKTRPDAAEPPIWHEVALEMNKKLYPQSDGRRVQDESTETIATSYFLNLAQEYETAFGRSDLHYFLQQMIRDEDFRPGEAHFRLLRLPWHDVFTTNWDTLLERACSQVVDRPYSIIRDMNEIPLAHRPRIVKLHGSLPAQYPLIVTEEDYRTYPTRFAPLVNTVQQAMMETVFCLIGFSANDPNFLQWSGWVRDNLGALAPKIYLAGWLDLLPHRRRMLEGRGVVPIDLARHPKAHEWPEHLCQSYATEWVLYTLERGRPYDFKDWPSPSRQSSQAIPECLQPVMEVTSELPKAELPGDKETNPGDLPEAVRRTLKIWEHNRKLYPGWLVLPAGESRGSVRMGTDEWEHHILGLLPDLLPVERLNAIRELVWRRELLLEPISADLESAAVTALESIDCHERTINKVTDTQIIWGAVREAWRTVALALLTHARFRFQRDLFDKRVQALEPFVSDDPDVEHRIRHERCLWAVYSLDFEALHGLLEDWTVEDCDPIWMIRKAALLWESDRNDEASKLVKHGLDAIHLTSGADRNVASASREGWALWSAINMDNRQEVRKRWNELAALNCDAMFEKDLIAREMSRSEVSQEAPAFDLRVIRAQRLSFSAARPDHLAYRALRLSEVAGLPPVTRHIGTVGANVTADILKLAAEKLARVQPELAIRIVLRVCNYDKDKALMRILSRSRVAILPLDIAETLAQICASVIEYALPRVAPAGTPGRNMYWVERMRGATEVLSRLVLRLNPDTAEDALDKALQCYRSNQVAQEFLLGESVGNLMQRSWESLPKEVRSRRVIDLLDAPIAGMDNFPSPTDLRYSDPGEFLQVADLPSIRASESADQWQETIRFLIRAMDGEDKARRQAAKRIMLVSSSDLLTQAESKAVANALWSKRHTGQEDLPGATDLFDWVFLLLPEPTPGLAERRFRSKWLSGDLRKFSESTQNDGNTVSVSYGSRHQDPGKIEDILWNIGAGIAGLQNHGQPLQLTDDEREYIASLVEHWASAGIMSHSLPFFQDAVREPTRWALEGLASILSECSIPKPLGERLYAKVQSLTDSGTPGFELTHGLVKIIPNRFDELVAWLRMGLASDDSALVTSAMSGLSSWLSASVNEVSSLRSPPDDMLREVGFVIASRRIGALPEALQLAEWVFKEGTADHRDAMSGLTIQGLSYLAEELRYDRERDPEENIDLPLLRWFCVRLAMSMAEGGFRDEPAVDLWLKLGREDPLPEVRYAAMPLANRATQLS